MTDEKEDLVRKSFVVTGIAAALNGADDHLVRKDSHDEASGDDSDDEDFLGFTAEDINNMPGLVSDYSDESDSE